MRRALPLLYLMSRLALAAEAPEPHDHAHYHHAQPEAKATAPVVSAEILDEFKAFEALAARSAFAEAERKALALMPRLQDNPPAQALLLRNLALVYGQQKHYLHAAATLQQSLDTQGLSAADVTQTLMEMTQFYIAAEQYPKAAESLSTWLKQTREPKPEYLLLLADLRGRLKEYSEAAALLDQLIATAPAPKPEWIQQAAQYHVAANHYPKAAETLTAGLARLQAPPPELLLLLAEIRTQLKQYPAAAQVMETLIARSPEPKTEWYQMLLGLHHENHDLASAIKVLSALIARAPDQPLYWQQLSGLYVETKQERKALAVQQLMYARGLLRSPEEKLQLVQALRYQALPARAAEILQRELGKGGIEKNPSNLTLLADAWTEARELGKAALAMEQAAALANTGETRHRLGQIYSELHDWPRARQTLTLALKRGGLNNPGGAYLLLGMANYRLNAKAEARAAFIQAKNTPAISRMAQQWLDHLDRETQKGSNSSH